MNIDKKTAKILATWGIAMLIFFVVAIVCVFYIFMPVEEHFKQGENEYIFTHSAISLQGGALLAESWKIYPEYATGLGISGIMAFVGACWCIYNMYKKESEGD